MRRCLVLGLTLFIFLYFTLNAVASIGVGVGTGKIEIKEAIKSGKVYKLPPVIVFNTGTESARYEMAVTLNQTQNQLKPNPSWFSFSPKTFTLEPHKSQTVTPTFSPPLKTQPGDYFAYLEARPKQTVKQGKAIVGVAAATKLYFKVEASNIFLSLIYRLVAVYQLWAPWSYLITIIAILIILYLVFKRYLKLNIKITRNIDNNSQ